MVLDLVNGRHDAALIENLRKVGRREVDTPIERISPSACARSIAFHASTRLSRPGTGQWIR